MSEATYQFNRRKLGSLDCGVVSPTDETRKIRSLAVLCHGFGAGGDDLVGLATELLQIMASDDATMLVFPAAPLSLDDQGMPGGRAWWLLSLQRLMSAMENGRYEEIREEVPDGIDDARSKLVETIDAALGICELDKSSLLLGGFSQGAMLAADTALRGLETPPAKLCLYSGCLVCERQWKANASKLKTTSILQSHGKLDSVLPFQTGAWLTELLRDAGCEVDFVEFPGVHSIPPEAIEKTANMLSSLSAEQRPSV